MRNWFTRLPISTQFRLLASLVLVLTALMAFLLAGRAYIANAQSRARAVADLVEDVGTWASRHRGVWVRSDSGDPAKVGESLMTIPVYSLEGDPPVKSSRPAPSKAELSEADLKTLDGSGGFHLKNPELVQRELLEVAGAAGRAVRFRVTSDKFMNSANAPTRFELAAIESMRESGGTEIVEVKGDALLYARRLSATAACLACHETPAKAPAAVRARYPDFEHGYGYQLGAVIGVISVSMPVVGTGGTAIQSIGVVACVAIGAFVASMAALLWFVQSVVIAPVQRLSRSTAQVSESDIADIQAAALRFTQEDSNNEVHRLDRSIKQLLRSLSVQRRF